MTGSGNIDVLEQDRILLVAQRVAGAGVGHADGRRDVAGADRVDVFAMVGVHAQDAPDALFLATARVVDVRALFEHAGIDPEVRQVAVRVGRDLEGQRGEGLIVIGLARDVFVALRILAGDRLGFERRGQKVDHGIEQRLDALVFEGRAAQHRQHRRRRSSPCAARS